MILVDSSVWIDLLPGKSSPEVARLRRLLTDGEAVAAAVIVQEILQGARSEQALMTLRARFLALPLLPAGTESHAAAGALYARCRWQGITPRSPHDCLIATLALEHDVALLAADRDFHSIRSMVPELRLLNP